jgi:hypothetical protein
VIGAGLRVLSHWIHPDQDLHDPARLACQRMEEILEQVVGGQRRHADPARRASALVAGHAAVALAVPSEKALVDALTLR